MKNKRRIVLSAEKEEEAMKKGMCVLLALTVLLGLSARADTDDWEIHESAFGFTMLYPAFLLDAYGVPAADAWWDTEMFEPRASDADAAMWYLAVPEDGGQDWEGEGWQRLTVDEPSVEMDVPFDLRYALYQSENGETLLEEVRLQSPVADFGYEAGFEYVFDLRFPAEDDGGWRDIFERMLETAAFPPQPAQAGSFRLDFFYGGAAGMQFIPVIVDEEAEPVVLRAQAEVSDFVLEKLTWDEETFSVSGTDTLYAADTFTFGDNLEIFCYFSDVLPDLRIRCVNGDGEAECWYLFQSGRDGSLLLLSEDEIG